MRHRSLVPALTLCLLTPSRIAQNTVPHWSTFFAGTGREDGVVVRRGPSRLVTVAGHSTSNALATTRAFQTAMAGRSNAFVARFDPSQPPAQQLPCCTYLGGSGLEYALDVGVDSKTGVTTLVGLTLSTKFPAPPRVQDIGVLGPEHPQVTTRWGTSVTQELRAHARAAGRNRP